MTPGLAGFVASGDDAGMWDAAVLGVLAALGKGFTVVPERAGVPGTGGARRRTWFDTFDWRLYRAGLALEYVAAHRGGELRLASIRPATGDTRPAAGPGADGDIRQPVTGWLASRPHRLQDLPEGPIAARVTGLAAPRALLPVVTVSSTVSVSRLLNEDGKTVARLLVERPLVERPLTERPLLAAGRAGRARHAGRAPLAPRLTVAAVRGYHGQARRAARMVSLAGGVLPAAEPVFASALRALGRRPGDYSNKAGPDITAGMPAAEAAAVILLRLLDTTEANVPGVLRDIDTEFLHDLRVSVRRTRSALKLFGDVLTGPSAGRITKSDGLTEDELARFTAEFKWVGDLTTPARDLDVHLLGFEETARTLKAAKPDDLEPFRAYLTQRRLKEYRALARGLRSPRFAALTRDWRAALTKIIDNSKIMGEAVMGEAVMGEAVKGEAVKGEAGPDARAAAVRPGSPRRRAAGTAEALAADRTRRAFAKVVRRGAAITPASPHAALHDLRKRCKELRYVLEFFAPLHDPAAYGKVIADLRRLQDCLGEFQDTDVQIGEIRALAASMLAAGEAPAVTLLAMGEVTAGLAARQQAARADFERRFAAFAGEAGQRRMALLLRGGAG
jgi:CHAD domain-containing protein